MAFIHNQSPGVAFSDRRTANQNEQERPATGIGAALVGTLLGGIGGCLLGIGLLTIPGINLLIVTGTAEATLLTTIVGAGVGAVSFGLIGALTCPPSSAN